MFMTLKTEKYDCKYTQQDLSKYMLLMYLTDNNQRCHYKFR